MQRFFAFIDRLEEGIISVLLALMVLITFSQVCARYIFNAGWGSALETTQVLFAWLILFGMSYGIKHGVHLGVDILIRSFAPKIFKAVAFIGALLCAVYGLTFFSAEWTHFFGADANKGGAYFYWSKIYKIGIGMESISLPEFIYGPDERLPRWVAYLILPVGLLLFILRSLQAAWLIWTDKREMIIASHEAEELVEQNKDILKD